jgi:hypothetical protein
MFLSKQKEEEQRYESLFTGKWKVTKKVARNRNWLRVDSPLEWMDEDETHLSREKDVQYLFY